MATETEKIQQKYYLLYKLVRLKVISAKTYRSLTKIVASGGPLSI